jgi:hypothetical protein
VTARLDPLAFVALLGLATCSTRTKATDTQGPFFSILPREGPTGTPGGITPAAVSLALGSLPPGELTRLREHLQESTDSALRRAAPGLFDLDDAAPDPLRPSLPDLPALTAAANLLGAPWNAPGISVQLGPACRVGATRCVSVFGAAPAPEDALVRRCRSLAWALGHAGLLRAAPSARPGLLVSLRESQRRLAGTVAMVFDAPRGRLDEAELDRLRQEARRELEQLASDAPPRPWLEGLRAARPDWELPIALDADEMLVVPRLSALARLQDFASEVERSGTFEWIVRPQGAAPAPAP